MTNTLTVSNKIAKIGDLIEQGRDRLVEMLPSHIPPDRFIRIFLSSLRKTPKLTDCKIESLFSSMMQAAQMGLQCDGVLGHAYLVPFRDECVLVPGYKGLMQLVRQSGEIESITAECVFDGDVFTYELGDSPKIKHLPSDEVDRTDDKKVTHVYTVVRLKGGGIQRQVWTRKMIDDHARKYSKGLNKSDSPWKTAWQAMAKKTVLRSIAQSGLLPISADVQSLVNQDMMTEVEFHNQGLSALAKGRVEDIVPAEPDPRIEADSDNTYTFSQGLQDMRDATNPEDIDAVYKSYAANGNLAKPELEELEHTAISLKESMLAS